MRKKIASGICHRFSSLLEGELFYLEGHAVCALALCWICFVGADCNGLKGTVGTIISDVFALGNSTVDFLIATMTHN